MKKMLDKYSSSFQDDDFIVTLSDAHIKGRWLNIPCSHRYLFPDNNMAQITLIFNGVSFHTSLRLHPSRKHNLAGGGLTIWFREHTELLSGSRVRIKAIELKRKFQIEII